MGKKKVATQVMVSLAEVATAEVKKTGIFTIPGLCRIKTRMKPAQGRQEGGLRQDVHCQGQAGKEDCQGLPRCGPEGKHLSASHAAADVCLPVLRGATRGTGSALAESWLWRVAAAIVDPAEA